jgi:hypothetical protein
MLNSNPILDIGRMEAAAPVLITQQHHRHEKFITSLPPGFPHLVCFNVDSARGLLGSISFNDMVRPTGR